MEMYKVYYSRNGEESVDTFACDHLPTEAEVMEMLVREYDVFPEQSIDIYKQQNLYTLDGEREFALKLEEVSK